MDQVSVDSVFGEFDQVLQSNQKFLAEGHLTVNMHHIHNLIGFGNYRKKYSLAEHNLYISKKRSLFMKKMKKTNAFLMQLLSQWLNARGQKYAKNL